MTMHEQDRQGYKLKLLQLP